MNESGSIYNFDYSGHTLITALDGLGFSNDITYLKFDNYYEKVEKNIPIQEINATLIFLKGYIGYTSFLDYLKSSKELKLFYKADTLKYINVEVKLLSKTDLLSGVLQCSITFDKLSLWLKESKYEIKVNNADRGKVYPFTYPYFYSASFMGRINVKNSGAYKAPLIIEMIGEVNNPEVNIIKNGEVLSTLRLNVVNSSCNVKVSSVPNEQYMLMNESNIYQYQDFTQDNFLFLDIGDYEIEFKPGVSSDTICVVTLIEGYLGN